MSEQQNDDIPALIRPEVARLSAYHVPSAEGMIKLDAMENPYPWPGELSAQWLQALREVSVNRYPDPHADELRQTLREFMAVPAGAECMLGNGSDELIQIILMAIAEPGRVVMAPEPSFVMYRMIAGFVGMDFAGVALREDFSLDRETMLAAIEARQPAAVFLAYPNNPTGNLFDVDTVHAIIHNSPGLVIVDEAYHAFAGRSFMSELERYDNLLVMRTVSKTGLAGLRLGVLAGAPRWLRQFDKVRLPYNINVLTQISARFALRHHRVLTEQTEQIGADREELYKRLQAFESLEVFPSSANFILFRTAAGQADTLFAGLKQRGILIKNLSAAGGLLRDCLRVTVGTPQENAAFLAALGELLG